MQDQEDDPEPDRGEQGPKEQAGLGLAGGILGVEDPVGLGGGAGGRDHQPEEEEQSGRARFSLQPEGEKYHHQRETRIKGEHPGRSPAGHRPAIGKQQ